MMTIARTSLQKIRDLTVAIEVGLVIACVLFMKRVMETTEISVITDEIDPNKESDIAVNEENIIIPKGVEVYEINGPYFFGIATKFEETMSQLGDRPSSFPESMKRYTKYWKNQDSMNCWEKRTFVRISM